MWVAPWRRVGVSVLIATLAVSVYAAGRSGSVTAGVSSAEEIVERVAVARPLQPAATTVVRPIGDVDPRRYHTSEASRVDLMSTSIRSALAAWSEFVGSGDIRVLDGYFDPGGPQHRQLASEATRLGAEVQSPRFDLVGVRRASKTDSSALVDTWIVLSVGDDSAVLRWRFHLTPFEERWQVWTIEQRASRKPSPAPE